MTAWLSYLLFFTATASAHPLGFGVLDVEVLDVDDAHYTLRLSPEEGREAEALRVRWPSGCSSFDEVLTHEVDGTLVRQGALRCDDGLEDGLAGELAVQGLGPELTVLVRIHRGSSVTVQSLDASHPHATLSVGQSTLVGFVVLGLEHAATGIDHLLFLIGVVFLAGTARRTVLAVSAFTVGHALTLALATLGALSVDVAAVELCIAVSLVALAYELTRRGEGTTLGMRQPALLSGAFGLLHGLGFATALGDTGLPAAERVVPLVGFHLGIEVVQLAVVLGVLGLLAVTPSQRVRIARGAAYLVGIAGVALTVDRF